MKVKINGKIYDAKELLLVPKPTTGGMTWDIIRLSDRKVIENVMEVVPGLGVA